MNIDNGFDLNIAIFFATSTQLGVLGTKYQDLAISFCLGKGETIPQFHLWALQARSEIFYWNTKQGK